MSRKDFEAIARVFAEQADYNLSTIEFDDGHNFAHAKLAENMADYLATTNPNFDRTRFLAACGVSK